MTAEHGTTPWTRALPLADLPPGSARLLRFGREQVALFRLLDGRAYAVDNRCPHEGYPLVQGAVSGETLTCVWHNFKFDLRDGACLLGDENVRPWPIRVVDGIIEVDLTPPDPSAEIARLWHSLELGLRDDEIGRMARDTARLIDIGVDPVRIAAFAARYDAIHAEYGSTHALAVCADVARLLPRYPGQAATLPLTQALEIAARPNIRLPERPVPEAQDPGEDPAAAATRIRALVEAEQGEQAEALLRGGLARGWRRAELEPLYFQLCADHFLDFGHALIYSSKVFDLLDATGWEHADPILRALLSSISLGTREDLLPPWAGTRRRLEIVAADLPRWAAMARAARAGWERPDDEGPRGIAAAILDPAPAKGFQAVRDALESGAPIERIVDGLVLAASERILHFDPALELSREFQNGWLDVTHLLTFASAVRHALRRYDAPDGLRLLFQSAHFTQRAGALEGPADPKVEPSEISLAALRAAVAAHDAPRAAALAGALWLADAAAFEAGLLDLCLDDPAVRGVVVAHAIKTALVALDEARALGSALPVRAVARFLASPLHERRPARVVREAVALVVHGKIPRDLTITPGGRQAEAG